METVGATPRPGRRSHAGDHCLGESSLGDRFLGDHCLSATAMSAMGTGNAPPIGSALPIKSFTETSATGLPDDGVFKGTVPQGSPVHVYLLQKTSVVERVDETAPFERYYAGEEILDAPRRAAGPGGRSWGDAGHPR